MLDPGKKGKRITKIEPIIGTRKSHPAFTRPTKGPVQPVPLYNHKHEAGLTAVELQNHKL